MFFKYLALVFCNFSKSEGKIKPSKLSKDRKPKSSAKGSIQRKRKKNKTATLKINKVKRIAPEHIPEGSVFKGLKPYTVQGLQVAPFNTRYLLEQWQTPKGNIIAGTLPPQVDGHFDSVLKSFILYQYHQPLILEQLQEWDIDISACQINRILNKGKDHSEKGNIRLQKVFDDIFTQQTDFQLLNLALKRLHTNKIELLLVLDRAEIPLDNNLSENDICEYVKKRKISGRTRSEDGRKSHNALSLMVCREWNWTQPNGILKDGVCRGLMLKLHRDGCIKLPPAPP